MQKLETKGFLVFQVEEIYTEKMITLSNVSLEQLAAGGLKELSTEHSCGLKAGGGGGGSPFQQVFGQGMVWSGFESGGCTAIGLRSAVFQKQWT